MAKPLKDILQGVKKSTVSPGSIGKNPGVDYDPKAKSERDLVASHEVEKHEDRVGNTDAPYKASGVQHSQAKEKKHGYKSPEDQKVHEEDLGETLKPTSSMADWIRDFMDSDAPQFSGKSSSQRRKMAIAAYYAAQKRNEETSSEEVSEVSTQYAPKKPVDHSVIKKVVKDAAVKRATAPSSTYPRVNADAGRL